MNYPPRPSLWRRWRATIGATIGAAVIVWAIFVTNVTSRHADQLSRDVATLTAQQAIEACQTDNRTREEVSHAMSRVLDDVDIITDDPQAEAVIADLRDYIRDQLAQQPCAVPATIDGGHG